MDDLINEQLKHPANFEAICRNSNPVEKAGMFRYALHKPRAKAKDMLDEYFDAYINNKVYDYLKIDFVDFMRLSPIETVLIIEKCSAYKQIEDEIKARALKDAENKLRRDR